MKRYPLCFALLVLIISSSLPAQWYENGKPAPDEHWSKTKEGFGAALFITDDPEDFFEQWNQPAAPGYMPNMTTVSSVFRGDSVAALVMFGGCKADEDGNCQVEGDYRLLKPDGTLYSDLKGADIWSGKPAPGEKRQQVCAQYLGILFEPDDPYGGYRFEVVVRDKIAGLEMSLYQDLEVSEYEEKHPEIQGGFSTRPLRKPQVDPETIPAAARGGDDWFRENIQTLTNETLPGMRERLFYLVDSRVKDTFAREGKVWPSGHDPVMQTLYSWSEQLGVYGGNLIYGELKEESSPAVERLNTPPESMELSLAGDVLKVASPPELWEFSIPYYFMIWDMKDLQTTNGMRTQWVMMSTGAHRHMGRPGMSQATLWFIFSPGVDFDEFDRYWVGQLGFGDESETISLPVNDLTSRKQYDATQGLNTEFTTWQSGHGPVAVVYTGITGTFEWNRPHFIDLIRSVSFASAESDTD